MRHSTRGTNPPFAFDLHVLSTPPAFNLSQNQTLQFEFTQMPRRSKLPGTLENLKESLLPFAIRLSMNSAPSLGADIIYKSCMAVCQEVFYYFFHFPNLFRRKDSYNISPISSLSRDIFLLFQLPGKLLHGLDTICKSHPPPVKRIFPLLVKNFSCKRVER